MKWSFCAGVALITIAPAFAANCNAPQATPVVTVELPRHPFQAVISADGCWIFAGMIGQPGKPVSGIAVLRRGGGKIELARTVPLEHGATGIVLTHDGKLLIAAVGAGVGLLDVGRMKRGMGGAVVAPGTGRPKPGPGFAKR